MLAVVIPAKNEAGRIQTVMRQVLRLPVSLVFPVLNGCADDTLEIVQRLGDGRVRPLVFKESLGYDVPRIAGARAALNAGARQVLFVDADLAGPLHGRLTTLVEQARRRATDLSLSDCYAGTPVPYRDSAASKVYQARVALNRALGREDLDAAIPSHGPVVASRRLLERVPPAAVGVPPLMQALAIKAGLTVAVGVHIPHHELGSAQRDREHRLRIAETIIGDCLAAICLAEGCPADRQGHIGYHAERRFDLLGLEAPESAAPEWIC
ncbi:MAG TPA: glycosyltransferase [Symbiobacteriaceae bacterium]|jgi:hypothetical protein